MGLFWMFLHLFLVLSTLNEKNKNNYYKNWTKKDFKEELELEEAIKETNTYDSEIEEKIWWR